MTPQSLPLSQQQSKSDPPPSTNVLQRAGVHSTSEQATESQDGEGPSFLESRFQHNFTQVPVTGGSFPIIQPKLTIGPVGDKYEQEADQVAAEVVQHIHSSSNSTVQPQESEQEQTKPLRLKSVFSWQVNEPGMTASPDLESLIQQSRSSGESLPLSVQIPMEQSFGADFSSVKIHADDRANQLNQSLQSSAFTTGQDIFFQKGAYTPTTREGQELIAHELTHVVQQNGNAVKRKPLPSENPTQETNHQIELETGDSNSMPQVQRQPQRGAVSVRQDTGSQGVIQRGEKTKKFFKAQLFGLNKTVNPLFGWKGYYKNLADIWLSDEKEAQAKYGGTAWRILNSVKETTDRVASYFTAAAFLSTGLGLILTPFTAGASAAFLGAATIFGQIATIAHLVTAALRLVVIIYNALRLRKIHKDHPNYAVIRARLWSELGGLASNALGAIFGGLTGGLALSGGPSVIGDPLVRSIGTDTASGTVALMGEGVNRLADASATGGSLVGDTAPGKSKYTLKEDTQLAANSSPTPIASLSVPRAKEDTPAPSTNVSVAKVPEEISSIVESSGEEDSQAESPQVQSPQAADSSLEELSQDAAELGKVAIQDQGKLDTPITEGQKTQQDLEKADQDIDHLLGKSQELSQEATQADSQAAKTLEENKQDLKGVDASKLEESKISQAETKLKEMEVQEGIQSTEDAEVQEESESEVSSESISDNEAEAQPLPINTRLGRSLSAPAILQTKPAPPLERMGKPVVQRANGKVKKFFGKLFSRFVNLRKRVKKVWAKVRAKLAVALIKVLGLEQPIRESQMENQIEQAQVPQGIVADQQSKNITTEVIAKTQQIKKAVAEAKADKSSS